MIARATLLLAAALAVLPARAHAHSPVEGMNEFYNGVLHPLLVPAHILLILATGLFLGQRGPRENRLALPAFFLAAAAGLALAGSGAAPETVRGLLLAGTMAIGLLTAVGRRAPLPLYPAAGAFAGFFLGLDSAPEALEGRERILALVGTGVGLNLWLIYACGVADFFSKKPWQRIGLRILGSWVAASSILVLALTASSR
ncbi:HupE/UreJ family protein [Lentisalinibacter sediminis]|uniref:HupE/UreJ family protein n=1 Tax=Lentisalinibacter sediminis TaxID=2992237 RepID=UPI003869168A